MNLTHALVVSHAIDEVWLAERRLTRDKWDPDQHAVDVYRGATVAMTAFNGAGVPVLCGGVMGDGPGVLHTFLFGARGWEEVIFGAVRAWRHELKRLLAIDGIHRIQCVSLCQHPRGQRFLELLGLTYEHELRGWGKHGESFFMFARVRED